MNSLILFICMIFSGLASTMMARSRDWDFLNYHFYDGYAFLHHRLLIDCAPAGLWSFFNPLLDAVNDSVIFYINDIFWTPFILGMISGIGFFIFYHLIRMLFKGRQSSALYVLSALFIGITAPTVFSQIGSTQNDFQSACFILLGIYFALKALIEKNTPHKKMMLFSGLATGTAVGLKLTNSTYFIGLVFALFLNAPKGKRISFNLFFLLGFLLGFLMINGWWMLTLYQHFHSPVFPFYNAAFHSPDYPFSNFKDPAFSLHSWKQILTSPLEYSIPNHLSSERFMQDSRLAILMLLSILYLLSRFIPLRWRPAINEKDKSLLNFLLTYTWISYVVWILQFNIYRYAIPIELMSAVSITFLLHILLPSRWSTKVLAVILIALNFFIIQSTSIPLFIQPPLAGNYVGISPMKSIPPNALIVLTGVKQSFVIPFFQPSIIFVSTSLQGGRLKEISFNLGIQAIKQHSGPLFILFGHGYPNEPDHPVNVLNKNGLTFHVDLNSCQTISTNESWQPVIDICACSATDASSPPQISFSQKDTETPIYPKSY